MVRAGVPWYQASLIPVVVLSTLVLVGPAYPLQVTAKADVQSVQIGKQITVTVTATRSDSLHDPQFAGAGIQAGPSWQLGGQLTQSPGRLGSQEIKIWQFELVAAWPDSTRVIPVVYLGGDPSLGHRADSILGAPILLIILPLPKRPLWPWIAGAALAVSIPTYLIARSLRRKSDPSFERPAGTPLEEALEMLEAIRVNRREDRAQRYLADLERVLDGYISRRLGESLTGKTASEIVAAVAQRVLDHDVLESLQSILQSCAASRFGGVRTGIDALVELDERARQALEHMDSKWV